MRNLFKETDKDTLILNFKSKITDKWYETEEIIFKLRMAFLKEICNFIFDNYKIKEFSWIQYTSYNSNKGFHAYTEGENIVIDNNEKSIETRLIAADISYLFDIFDDEIFLDLFGDHSIIKITREGCFISKNIDHN